MSRFQNKYGPWALITGASSGIGAEFARQLAARGLNTILVARRRDRLEALAEELAAAHGIDAKAVSADVSTRDFMDTIRPQIDGLEIGLLINNAGFATVGRFIDNDLDRELDLLHVNCRAGLILSHELIPAMRDRRRGGIVFVSSLIAFMPGPFWSGYAASKVHDLYIAEALRAELKAFGVDVTAVCPGPTSTEFGAVSGTRSPGVVSGKVTPVVKCALNALGKKPYVIPGLRAKGIALLMKIAPWRLRSYVMTKVLRKYSVMNDG